MDLSVLICLISQNFIELMLIAFSSVTPDECKYKTANWIIVIAQQPLKNNIELATDTAEVLFKFESALNSC